MCWLTPKSILKHKLTLTFCAQAEQREQIWLQTSKEETRRQTSPTGLTAKDKIHRNSSVNSANKHTHTQMVYSSSRYIKWFQGDSISFICSLSWALARTPLGAPKSPKEQKKKVNVYFHWDCPDNRDISRAKLTHKLRNPLVYLLIGLALNLCADFGQIKNVFCFDLHSLQIAREKGHQEAESKICNRNVMETKRGKVQRLSTD